MLDNRARILLKTLVERYIAEGQPVGSRALSRFSGLDLSPATIRNVMADLEEQGFIASPHTSAGRIPTPRGYRLFVDSLLAVQPLQENQIHEMEGQLIQTQPQQLIGNASHLLSELTQFAGIVVTPRRKTPTIRQIEFLGLSEKRILLIIVTTDGDVQNRILLTERPYSPSELTTAANYLNHNYAGLDFDQIRQRLTGEIQQLQDDLKILMASALEAGNQALNDSASQYVISNNADGVQIYIGGESGLAPLDECSVVTAPYEVNGQVVGSVGVIGPTRMAYERVIPIVDITAKLLSSALTYQANT